MLTSPPFLSLHICPSFFSSSGTTGAICIGLLTSLLTHRLSMESTPKKGFPEMDNAQTAMGTTVPSKLDTSPSHLARYEQLSECLRRLKEDLVIFRDPMVRNYLETIPLSVASNSPLPSSPMSTPPTRETLAQHLATILNLRTTLAEAETALKEARETDLSNRKRAARAEGELAELRSQYEDHQRAQSASIDDAAARIRTIESDALANAESSRAEISHLSRRVAELDSQASMARSAAGTAKAQVKSMEARALAAENELSSVKKASKLQVDMAKSALKAAEQREKRALDELSGRNESSRKFEDFTNEALREERKRADLLEQQTVQLKSDIEWMSGKVARTEEELLKSEVAVAHLQERAEMKEHAELETEALRKRVADLEQQSQDEAAALEKVVALSRERDELREIICSLVPSGDVHEAVNVLRQLANGDVDAISQLQGTRGHGETQNNFSSAEVESLQDKVKMLEAGVAHRDVDLRHEALNKNLNARVQQLLQKEPDSLRARGYQLEKRGGDADGDVDMDESSSSHPPLDEYRDILKELEANLADREKEVYRLRDEVAALKNEGEGKKESEVVLEEGTPDFDCKVSKVVHMDENPLRTAMVLWRAETGKRQLKKRTLEATLAEDDVMSKIDAERIRREMLEMQQEFDELKRRAVMGDRTRRVAMDRIEEVRNAVYNLFGWSMKVTGTLYRLTSIYADSPEEVLHFAVNEKGTMSLIDSAYAQKLHRETDQFVGRMDSFPALLAHVTTENFEKTTAFLS